MGNCKNQSEKKIRISGKRKINIDKIWLIRMSSLTFFLSILLTLASTYLMKNLDIFSSMLALLFIIFIGIIFDIIGVSVTTANAVPFHAMAAKKIKGATEAIKLIKAKEKVSNFCNDVIGDTCGIVSGCASSALVSHLIHNNNGNEKIEIIIDMLITGIVAAVTVGGRAVGKTIAITNCNTIIYNTAKILNLFNFFRKNKKCVKNKI